MNTSNPELQRLLAALKQSSTPSPHSSSLSSSNNVYGQPAHNNNYVPYTNYNASSATSQEQQSQIPGLGNEPFPAVSARPILASAPTVDPRARRLHPTQPQSRSQTSTPTPQQPAIADASAITVWPAAIKHIAKHIIPNEATSRSIKKLIDNQHTHEETWAKQRQEIIMRHAGRGENTVKVAGLLAELGGLLPLSNNTINDTKEEKARKEQERDKELEVFDRKVYKNLVAMSRDVDKELRRLGVPFFAIKWDLVSDSGGIGKLDKGELRDLQKRMVEYLEDLLVD